MTNKEGLGNILQNTYNTMQKKGIDRLTLDVSPLNEERPTTNGFTSTQKIAYYPEGELSKKEQELQSKGKPYTAVSLVEDQGDVYIEVAARQPIKDNQRRFLPPMKTDESFGNYITDIGYTNATEWGESIPASSSELEQAINTAVQNYDVQTREKMREAGVYDALQQNKERPVSELEQRLGTSLESKLYK